VVAALPSSRVILVGLTGGIGSGKSTVSAVLAERGAVIVDADAITRELQQPGQPVLAAMAERFGAGILGDDGTLDRAGLAAKVFTDGEALRDLNAIVHPAVGAEILRRIDERRGTDAVVVLDVALLVEHSVYPMSGVIVVDAPVEVAVDRLVRLRGMGEADARARIARQITREERLARADRVVDNGGDRNALLAQIDDLWAWVTAQPPVAGPPPSSG
jgi:dephospho-CoA kinase